MHGATLAHDLVQIVVDPLGEKGDIAVLSEDVCMGTALLVEAPVLLTSKASPAYNVCLQRFAASLKLTASNEEELVMVPALVARWLPTLHSYAAASAKVRAKIAGMQTRFAEQDCLMSRVVSQMARRIHEEGVFGGANADWIDCSANGVVLAEAEIAAVLSSLLVNSHDSLPDGSNAIFGLGARFEHSCVPNTGLYISLSHKMPFARGVSHLPRGTWIGEWRSLRAIDAGKAATLSYLNDEWLAKNGVERRNMLLMKMGFNCRCERCKEELMLLESRAVFLSDMD